MVKPKARPRRKRAYELDGLIPLRAPARAQDQIGQIESQALTDLANEYRVLRIEELISKKRGQIAKGPSSGAQNQKDSLDLVKGVFEISQMIKGKENPNQTLEYLKFFNQMMASQGSPGFFEQYARAKEIGILGHTEGESNQFSVEMERLRGERMMESKKIDLELTKMRLEQEDGRQKIAMLAQFFSPLVALGGARMADGMREQGATMAANWRNPGNPRNPGDPAYDQYLRDVGIVEPGSLSGETAEMQIVCDCGFNKSMIVPVPPPPSLSCPGCGKKLNTAPQPSTDEESKAQWES